jgi:uncharacterized protein (TIGR03435 family)
MVNSETAFVDSQRSLIPTLIAELGVPVEDRTVLGGIFDVELRWSEDPKVSSVLPQLSTAVQEQLGLRLEARRIPVAMFVVDSIEKPAPD